MAKIAQTGSGYGTKPQKRKSEFLVPVMDEFIMPKRDCDIKLPCQNDLTTQCNDLLIQYNQLLCLRAELARRKDWITRGNPSAGAVKRNERPGRRLR